MVYVFQYMIVGDVFKSVSVGGDGVNFVFKNMNVMVFLKDYLFSYDGKEVKLFNGVYVKWYILDKIDLLIF